MDDIQLEQKKLNDETLVIKTGRALDNNNAHEMVDIISTAQAKGYKYIIVDMSLLEFISSAGVGSILGTVEISRFNGGDIILCRVANQIKHVFELLDLLDYLTIRDSEQDAHQDCGINE
jgi:anti-anti-sigma factor